MSRPVRLKVALFVNGGPVKKAGTSPCAKENYFLD